MENIGVRIFGASDCVKCQAIKKAFDFYAIKFEYVDVNDPQNEKLCDDHNVEELPQIEAYYTKINKVFYVRTGYMSPIQFLEDSVKETQALQSELSNLDPNEVADLGKKEIQKMLQESQNKKKCNSCNRKNNV